MWRWSRWSVVEQRDTKALFDIGEDLDVARESCHLEFWYPGQRELMSKLDLAGQGCLRHAAGWADRTPAAPKKPV
jgi:hypothetical protein